MPTVRGSVRVMDAGETQKVNGPLLVVLPIVGLATLGILVFSATNSFASLVAKLLIVVAVAALLLWAKAAAQKPQPHPAATGHQSRTRPTYDRVATIVTAVLLAISVASNIHQFGFPSGAFEWLTGVGGFVISAAVLRVFVGAVCWVMTNAWTVVARLVRRRLA